MHYDVLGEVMQRLIITLKKGELIYAEPGSVYFANEAIQPATKLKGGILEGAKRVMTGESLFIPLYASSSDGGEIHIKTKFIGKILTFDLLPKQVLICQKGAFLCGQESVDIGLHIRHLTAGAFGGEGFIMQRIVGPGWVFLAIDGEVEEHNLSASETIRAEPGHVAFHEPSVHCGIEFAGFKNVFFGGFPLFWATLVGPGKVWLQTMPAIGLAKSLRPLL